ncbi:hypothetical protein KBK19_03530 [Microvirga sp. STR05]|uniref:Uncharacterized protein n=1 Tax=Hymenobacter duratus TaxID=2771356 RepID=A0ABR8JEG0_9BACT|nr:hypothetical protein [Hymenobacter duratus]MBD2714101.1 hypothetical protein [Hymenobacter duratus]MBR7949003.1 hypothetical protein [Microvirga sp. STR05]
MFQSIYGIRGLRQVPGPELRQLAKRYGIEQAQLVQLDTSYRQFLTRQYNRDSVAVKNHYQPLQVSYYDATGQLRCFYVNCHAGGGFPNINWNYQGGLNQFPPAPQAPLDTILPLTTYLGYLRTPEGQLLPPQPATDYTVVVQWSRFMGRQSRRLIEATQRNGMLAQGQSVRLLFVSNDNLQAYVYEQQDRRDAARRK